MSGQACLNHVENNNKKQSWCRRCHWQFVIPLTEFVLSLVVRRRMIQRTLGLLDQSLGWMGGQLAVSGHRVALVEVARDSERMKTLPLASGGVEGSV